MSFFTRYSKKFSLTNSSSILAIAALSPFYVTAEQPAVEAEKNPIVADIKPPLNIDAIDEEQMRVAKIIHKRITDYQEIKNKTNNNQSQAFAPFKETLNSGAQFEMLPIKGGTFLWKGEKEGDVLQVTLSPFWMGKAEVTWEEYDPFMYDEIPRQKDGQLADFVRSQITNDIDFITRPTTPYHPMTFGMPRDGRPAIGMTQHAANKYCQWISMQTGHFYRLPTEAEWEYACRAGSQTNESWGANQEDAAQFAYFGGDEASFYESPGTKKPNPWGLVDMQGNVLEWTLDQYVADRRAYFGKEKVLDPWVKATKPYPHVTKGGHWKQKVEEISASARIPSSPEWKKIDPQNPKSLWYLTNVSMLGMRLVRPEKIPTAEEMYHYWNSGVAADGEFAAYTK